MIGSPFVGNKRDRRFSENEIEANEKVETNKKNEDKRKNTNTNEIETNGKEDEKTL